MRNASRVGTVIRRAAMLLVPCATVLGTGCLYEIRQSVIAAGLDFVEGTVGTVIETLIPVEDILSSGE